MDHSNFLLDVHADHIAVELQLPRTALELAWGRPLTAERLAEIGPYLLSHIAFSAEDGSLWGEEIHSLVLEGLTDSAGSQYEELHATLWMRPPPGGDLRNFSITYDVLLHHAVTHEAYVALRHDWSAGRLGEETELLDVIRMNPRDGRVPTIQIRLAAGDRMTGFLAMLGLGMHHIAEGSDHMLFLLLLLLPAPLLARAGRWQEALPVRKSLGRILRISLAFTLGHSITLLVGSLGDFALPTQAIEVLIGVSILVSAVHAFRPLFARREVWIAGGFGLLHGMAFSFTISGLGLGPSQLALSILGFNLGIELMQLLIVLLVLPWLLLMASSPVYPWLRRALACLGAVAAMGWIIERLTETPNFVTETSEACWAQYKWLLLGLILLSLGSRLYVRWRRRMADRMA